MNIILVFGSVTAAKRVEKTIAKYGILSKTISTPKVISKTGCSHSIKLYESNLNDVFNIIRHSDVEIKGIYKEFDINGKPVYKEVLI